MNIHITAELREEKISTFQRLQALIDMPVPTLVEIEEMHRLVRSAVDEAFFYEWALGFGKSFQSHMGVLMMVLTQNMQGSIDVQNLRGECHRYLRYFENACRGADLPTITPE